MTFLPLPSRAYNRPIEVANGWRVVSNQMWPIKDQSFPIMYLLSICIYALCLVMQFLRFCPRTFPLYSSIVHRFAIILKLVQYLDRSKLESNICIYVCARLHEDCVSIQPFALRYSPRTLIRAFLPLFTIYDVLFWNGGQLRPRRGVGISFLSMVISAVEEKGGMLNPRCKENDRSIQGDAML